MSGILADSVNADSFDADSLDADSVDEEAGPEERSPRRRALRLLGFVALALVVLFDAGVLAGIGLGTFRTHRGTADYVPQDGPESMTQGVSRFLGDPVHKLQPCAVPTLIGTVIVDQVVARAAPAESAAPVGTFARTNLVGAPQVFDLVKRVKGKGHSWWYLARLPLRPNGTKAYLPSDAVKVSYTSYRLEVDREKFRLTLFEGCRVKRRFDVGIGTGATPTPVGRFFLTGLFIPPDPDTIYGKFIYTLSGYSEVLTSWKLGGIIGLHGTNDPTSIGRDSSHGCIRMLNEDIERLRAILPLGTPILIR
jgi:hypothetical protein